MADKITLAFLQHAAKVLTTGIEEGGGGLSGGKAVELTTAYAYDLGVDVKYARYPNDAPNKRSMLLENLAVFEPKQQVAECLIARSRRRPHPRQASPGKRPGQPGITGPRALS